LQVKPLHLHFLYSAASPRWRHFSLQWPLDDRREVLCTFYTACIFANQANPQTADRRLSKLYKWLGTKSGTKNWL